MQINENEIKKVALERIQKLEEKDQYMLVINSAHDNKIYTISNWKNMPELILWFEKEKAKFINSILHKEASMLGGGNVNSRNREQSSRKCCQSKGANDCSSQLGSGHCKVSSV